MVENDHSDELFPVENGSSLASPWSVSEDTLEHCHIVNGVNDRHRERQSPLRRMVLIADTVDDHETISISSLSAHDHHVLRIISCVA